MNQHHDLKLFDVYWKAVKTGHKIFEIRKNDRGFQDGDEVTFVKYGQKPRGDIGYYDGHDDWQYMRGDEYVETEEEADKMTFTISYVLPLAVMGIQSDYVVFGIVPKQKKKETCK